MIYSLTRTSPEDQKIGMFGSWSLSSEPGSEEVLVIRYQKAIQYETNETWSDYKLRGYSWRLRKYAIQELVEIVEKEEDSWITPGYIVWIFDLNRTTRHWDTQAASCEIAAGAVCVARSASRAAVPSGVSSSWESAYVQGPVQRRGCFTSCPSCQLCLRRWLRVHLSWTSPQARSIGLARGQEVGK